MFKHLHRFHLFPFLHNCLQHLLYHLIISQLNYFPLYFWYICFNSTKYHTLPFSNHVWRVMEKLLSFCLTAFCWFCLWYWHFFFTSWSLLCGSVINSFFHFLLGNQKVQTFVLLCFYGQINIYKIEIKYQQRYQLVKLSYSSSQFFCRTFDRNACWKLWCS